MIEKITHATVYVTDYQRALEFYRDKLGFEVRENRKFPEGYRWITVAPKSNDISIILEIADEQFKRDIIGKLVL
jgi:catechol 2,3-dioxygenase-like lactoylglutathione lyase family enzyme